MKSEIPVTPLGQLTGNEVPTLSAQQQFLLEHYHGLSSFYMALWCTALLVACWRVWEEWRCVHKGKCTREDQAL